MSHESSSSPDEAIRALTAEVTQRIRSGEKPEAIRAELLSGGLNAEIVEHILTEAASRATSRWRTPVAMTLSGVIVVVCTLAGLAGGLWAASEVPPAPGLAVMATCLLSAVIAILGPVLGACVGLGITALLARWSVSETELDV